MRILMILIRPVLEGFKNSLKRENLLETRCILTYK